MRLKTFVQSKWALLLVVTVGMITPIASIHAQAATTLFAVTKDVILYLISWALYYIMVGAMGWFATLATNLLVYTAQLNNFTDLPVIIEIWQVSRDLTNMAFIPILLVIAFGTLFRLEAYSWKKLLPKLILAAILVNYSRAICGFIVDAAQIVMLTFVAAIKDAADVGLTSAFQLDKLFQFGATNSSLQGSLSPAELGAVTTPEQRLLAIIAAGFMLSTMFTAQCIYIVVLVGRLVMIWFLTALSPFRAGAMILPQTERYASQYDETFIRYVTVGVMAVASLWFSMYVAAKAIDSGGLGSIAASEEVKKIQLENHPDNGTAGALNTTLISGFVIATMMLMLGMKLTQESSSELSGVLSKVPKAALLGTGAFIATKFLANQGADWLQHKTGVDLNAKRQWEEYQHKRHEQKQNRYNKGYQKAAARAERGDVLAWAGAAGYMGEHFAPFHGEMGIRSYIKRKIPFLGTNDKVDQAMAEKEKLEAQKVLVDQAVGQDHPSLNNLMDEESRRAKLLALQEQEDGLQSQRGYGDHAYDTTNAGDRSVLESHANLLQEQLKEAKESLAPDDAKIAALSARLKLVQSNLQVQGRVTVAMSSDEKDDAMGAAQHKIDTERSALSKSRSLGGAIKNAADLKRLLEEGTGAEDIVSGAGIYMNADQHKSLAAITANKKAANELNESIKKLSSFIQHNRLPADSDRMIKQRKVSQDLLKDVQSDNEEYLVDRLKTFEHHGDMSGVMAVAEYLSKVGHDNEIPRAFGLPASAAGMRAWADKMKAKGVDEQWLYNVMMQISQNAQANNHWQMAQMVGTKDGRLYLRSAEEQARAVRGESEKAGVNNILRNGNRLAWGEYQDADNKVYQMMPGQAALLAESLHTLTDTIKHKGAVNTNFAAHAALPNVDKAMRDLIVQTQKNEADRNQALTNWALIVRLGATKNLSENGSVGEAQAASIRRAEKIIHSYTVDANAAAGGH